VVEMMEDTIQDLDLDHNQLHNQDLVQDQETMMMVDTTQDQDQDLDHNQLHNQGLVQDQETMIMVAITLDLGLDLNLDHSQDHSQDHKLKRLNVQVKTCVFKDVTWNVALTTLDLKSKFQTHHASEDVAGATIEIASGLITDVEQNSHT
jgi:hypothetical protein